MLPCLDDGGGGGKKFKTRDFPILSRKTQGIWKFPQNTGNLVCSSCKFPDSKSKRYFNIANTIPNSFGSWLSLPSQFCVCYSHESCKLAQGKFVVRQQ